MRFVHLLAPSVGGAPCLGIVHVWCRPKSGGVQSFCYVCCKSFDGTYMIKMPVYCIAGGGRGAVEDKLAQWCSRLTGSLENLVIIGYG